VEVNKALDFQILKNVNIVHLVLPPEIMVQHTMTWCGGAICFQNLSPLLLHMSICVGRMEPRKMPHLLSLYSVM
jgi:hypothetical protein